MVPRRALVSDDNPSGRRSALEKLPFFSGYGVEIGLLIDLFEEFGLGAIAQVDDGFRILDEDLLDDIANGDLTVSPRHPVSAQTSTITP